jgi:hypothetical protein
MAQVRPDGGSADICLLSTKPEHAELLRLAGCFDRVFVNKRAGNEKAVVSQFDNATDSQPSR